MSSVGYYRYKLDNLSVGTHTVTFYINGAPVVTHTVIVEAWQDEMKLIKFLNRDGQYVFQWFNCYYETKEKPISLGTTSKIVTSILDSQTDKKQVGYKTKRIVSLVVHDISRERLENLSDIFTSPRVYLYVGDFTSDEEKDWIQVEQSGNNVVKERKKEFSQVRLDVTLPEKYSISML